MHGSGRMTRQRVWAVPSAVYGTVYTPSGSVVERRFRFGGGDHLGVDDCIVKHCGERVKSDKQQNRAEMPVIMCIFMQ